MVEHLHQGARTPEHAHGLAQTAGAGLDAHRLMLDAARPEKLERDAVRARRDDDRCTLPLERALERQQVLDLGRVVDVDPDEAHVAPARASLARPQNIHAVDQRMYGMRLVYRRCT